MDTKRHDTFMFRPVGNNTPGIDGKTTDNSNQKPNDK